MTLGDLKQRAFLFAVAVGKLCKELRYNAVNREYFHQIF
jgi:hypothetical protein